MFRFSIMAVVFLLAQKCMKAYTECISSSKYIDLYKALFSRGGKNFVRRAFFASLMYTKNFLL